jgi:hypothetical protein
MKNIKNTKNSLKVLSGLFLMMLLLFVAVASAEEVKVDETHATVASAGAHAIATGSETIASTQVTITGDRASASATSKAKAENGGTATAIADAWSNWIDGSSAHAHSTATAVAGIGETIWAEALAHAFTSTGKASTETIAYVGTDPKYIDPPDPASGGEKNNMPPKVDSFGGFIFGKGDIERYCHYKLQLGDNDTSNDKHAKYYMGIIAWDYGFSDLKGFENRYDVKCSTGLDMKDRTP